MERTRRGRSGFTLTEILMAVGILGIGLAMVSSVFPVAVDQSRRSREETMAALCARSITAVLEARRDKFIPWCRDWVKTNTLRLTTTAVPYDLQVYNPNSFLYDTFTDKQGQTKNIREYNTLVTDYGLWSRGNYVPVVFVTPMSTTGNGPWRITVIVYLARTGSAPVHLPAPTDSPSSPQLTWKDSTVSQDVRARPGEYIIDWTGQTSGTNYRGEAYMVDRVSISATAAQNDIITLASAPKQGNTGMVANRSVPITGPNGFPSWVSMPQAVAAYHTIIGE